MQFEAARLTSNRRRWARCDPSPPTNQLKEIEMSRPKGTKHECPDGYELIAKSIDPDHEPVLQDGQVLLIKAGPNHYVGHNPT